MTRRRIAARLRAWIADPAVDVVISTGGTGVTGRDVTPEALERVAEKLIPGFGELFRLISFNKIGTSALQSRATAGVAGGTYLFALPGSPSACKDGWDEILEAQLDIRHRPCNFAELLPAPARARGRALRSAADRGSARLRRGAAAAASAAKLGSGFGLPIR